jgi:hypothetical protein
VREPGTPGRAVPAEVRTGGIVQTIALVIAAAGNAVVGVWAAISPGGFYSNFPGAGHHWVATAGRYDQHLVLDVGYLSLALTVVLVAALLRRDTALVRTACVASLVFAVPHLAYHADHLNGFSTTDGAMEVVALAVAALAPAVALLTTFARRSSNAVSVNALTSRTRASSK